MVDGTDTVVLYNELAYHDRLPVQWQPLTRALDRFELTGLEEANLMLLQACVAVEEHPLKDKNEDLGPLAGELARLDFKLNLMMQLLGKLVSKDQRAPPTTIQFNAVGASWICLGAPPPQGAQGLLRIQLRSSLPQLMELPAEITAVDGSTVKAKFSNLSEPVAELIQKLAFLRHRRHVADVRKARR
jgi:hypothetical protein